MTDHANHEPAPAGDVPDTVPPDFAIAERHRDVLKAGGIDLTLAASFGIRTVENPVELPMGCSSLHGAPPGLLFPLPHLDGSITHQVRLDSPPVDENGKPKGKYMTQADHPAFATVWPTERVKLDEPEHKYVLITEGTKQTLAAVCAADERTLVLGIQGCWGWMSEQSPIDDFNDLVRDKMVVVAFDADVATNPNVHRAAKMFATHLSSACGAKSVRFLRTGESGTTGLDDYLGREDVSDPPMVLANLLKNSRKLPRAPMTATTGKSKQVLEVDLGEMVLRMPVDSAFDVVNVDLKGDVILGALPKIVETTTWVDDLGDSPFQFVEHSLEVSIPEQGTFTVQAADDELRDPGKWLARIPGGKGTSVQRPGDLVTRTRVENTIRTFDASDRRESMALLRTGWVHKDGQAIYVFPGGAIGPLTLEAGLSSRLTGVGGKISFPDPRAIEDSEIDDLRAFLGIEDALVDPTPFWALVGSAFAAVAGRPPSGLVMLVGKPGSGKTHIAKMVTSTLTPAFGPNGMLMASMEGTANAVIAAGAGLHHGFVLVDDVHQQMDRNRIAAQLDAVSTLARRSYSGGSAGKRRLTWDAKQGRVSEAYVDMSAPAVLMTAESAPDATLMRSLVERMLIIPVTKETTYKPDQAERMARLARDGVPNRVMARFIRWMSNDLTTDIQKATAPPPSGTDMTDFLTTLWADYEEKIGVQQILKRHISDARLREVLTPVVAGVAILLNYAVDAGAITVEQKTDTSRRITDSLIAAMRRHEREYLSGDAEMWRSTVNATKALVISGGADLLAADGDRAIDVSQNGKTIPIIGKYHRTQSGEDVVAILPDVAVRLLRIPSITTAADLGARLDEVVVRSKSSRTTNVRFGRQTARCLLIPLSAWEDA